jgi:hypothetical protein
MFNTYTHAEAFIMLSCIQNYVYNEIGPLKPKCVFNEQCDFPLRKVLTEYI